jgi:HPt (histidine-containing phosphotransfer) domain-containing protein
MLQLNGGVLDESTEAPYRNLRVYWIRSSFELTEPDPTPHLQQGITLQVLDSVSEYVAHLADGFADSSLLVVDMSTATSEPMHKLLLDNVENMKFAAWVVRSDVMPESAIQDFVNAGALDWVPSTFARDYLEEIFKKHFSSTGRLRLDPNNQVAAIDSHAAMSRSEMDVAFFGSLLRIYFDDLPKLIPLLRHDWSNDTDRFRRRSHSLKGVAATLGLSSLYQVASRAEFIVPDADGRLDSRLMVQLEGEMQSAIFQILRWLTLNEKATEVIP